MATYTNKLNLIKPEINDLVSPTVFADNFDKIDAAYGGLSSDLATTDSNLEKLNSNLGTKLDTSKIVTTEPKTYTSDENGVIYVNLHSNDIYGVLDADNTSSLTLIPFKGYGYVMLYVINPLTGERVPNASILLTVTYISK